MNDIIISCNNLHKTFHDGTSDIHILHDVKLDIKKGEQVAILGASGSGKSTLLQLLGGLDVPTKGEVMIDGSNMQQLDEVKKGVLRNHALGFVYQFHHLLPEFTALENVAMPLLIRGIAKKQAFTTAQELLQQVGLAARLTHKPAQLSGGERQRAAIARALVAKPACVLADEPTGNLDPHTAAAVYQVMCDLNRKFKTSFVVVTHDSNLAAKMDRRLVLEEGKLQQIA